MGIEGKEARMGIIGDQTLHEDDIHLFYGHNEYIEWAIEGRMISVGWHHQGWDRSKAMMAAVGPVPWSIV